MRPRPAGAARRRAQRGQGDQNALGCDSLKCCDQLPAGIVRSSLWSRRSQFRRVAALLPWVSPLTRAARGGAAADSRLIRGTGRLLSPPVDSSDASATSRLQRFSDFPAMASGPTPSSSRRGQSAAVGGRGVLIDLTDTTKAASGYETSRSGSKSSTELKLTQLFLSPRGAAVHPL